MENTHPRDAFHMLRQVDCKKRVKQDSGIDPIRLFVKYPTTRCVFQASFSFILLTR